MAIDEILTLFPGGEILHAPASGAIEMGGQRWYKLPTEQLTEREAALLDLLQASKQEAESYGPISDYFLSKKAPAPHLPNKLQFVHLHIWNQEIPVKNVPEWLQVIADVLPNYQTAFQTSPSDIVCIVDQTFINNLAESMDGVLEALQFDFGLRMTIFIGQVWSEVAADSLPDLFAQEAALYKVWRQTHSQAICIRFPKLFLWGQSQAALKLDWISNQLKRMISQQEDMDQVIFALWEEGAVLTKVAQHLYIHRNTLQYRLDKWYEQTGLQLKDLTDLALCYGLILDEHF